MNEFPSHNPHHIEFIQQRSKNDCGIACLAMLANLLYSSAKVILGGSKGGVFPDDLLEALEDLGFDYKEVKRLPGKKYPALVAIQWNDPKMVGHYIVWDGCRKQFLDPLYGLVDRKDMLKYAKIDHIWIVMEEEREDE